MKFTLPGEETIKLIVAVIIGCLLLYGAQKVLSWKEAAEQNETRGRTLQSTSGILGDGKKADEDRAQVDTGVTAGKQQFDNDYKEAKANEPATAARADRLVPKRVRDAYRTRRLARERSGCVGDDCAARLESASAQQR